MNLLFIKMMKSKGICRNRLLLLIRSWLQNNNFHFGLINRASAARFIYIGQRFVFGGEGVWFINYKKTV